jgi:acyl-CoA thioesterase
MAGCPSYHYYVRNDMSLENAISYSGFLGREAPFMDYLGMKTYADENGKRRMVLTLEHHHLNVALNTHGGVILTLLDVAMASACRLQDSQQRSCVTIEMKTSFLRSSGVEGECIEAHGIVRHVTRSLAFCDGELRGANGELYAIASGTFKYISQSLTASDG